MPRFAVILQVHGPFRHAAESEICDGAYTCRFVTAEDPDAAARSAVDRLRREQAFRSLRPSGDLPLKVSVSRVRAARLLEWRIRTPGWISYSESDECEARSTVHHT